ncbi:MAG: glycoside hydrolase family 65 protein [Ardenticatenaceae bacterium]|nr:glycoside hydrolase family 65 protein [Ardenticatenaceae bacterium]
MVLALGPAARFDALPLWPYCRPTLEGITLAELREITAVDPQWTITQTEFDQAGQHHMETVFTLGNGYFSTRGTFEEGFPGDKAITFVHGIFDDMPVSFTELVNMPDWLDTTIWVDGAPFRLDRGEVLHFYRQMDLRLGLLRRDVRWRAPSGAVVDLTFSRFVSYTQEHVGALRILATAVNQTCDLTLATGINGHVANEDLLHWQLLDQDAAEGLAWLHSRTRKTGMEGATAVAVTASPGTAIGAQNCSGQPLIKTAQTLASGQTLQVDKLISYAAARDVHPQAVSVVSEARDYLHNQTFDALLAAQAAAWEQVWAASDVIIEGDPEAQLATRFNLFQLFAAAPQHDDRVSIGAKTLSGYGYRGHVFWDTEIFILPFFSYTQPHIARNMLLYRYHTLAGARRKAARNGYDGAQYAWESAATGDEVTPPWVPHFTDPTLLVRVWTGDIQIHISADVAYAIHQYWQITGDDAFMRDYGAEMILDTARFWGSRVEREEVNGRLAYTIRDVIGPDEYHDHVDNNSYTNYIARWHLQTALEVRDWLRQTYPDKATALEQQLDLSADVYRHWQEVIDHLVFLWHEETAVIEQFEGFFQRRRLEPDLFASAAQSLQVILGIEGANESQVLKQADVIMLLCLFRDQFNQRTWQANWDAYMPITDHKYGSSLGPSFHAWAACEMQRPDEAYEHFMLAARADLRNPRGNAGDGIHAASAGGVWQALVFGFAGLRQEQGAFTLRPQLPRHWQRIAFNFRYRGEQKSVDIRRGEGGKVIATIN